MKHKAIAFGSIGVMAETSELQRECFNQALAEAGIDLVLDPEHYSDLLQQSGGRARLAGLLGTAEDDPAIVALHERKTRLFQDRLQAGGFLKPDFERFVRAASAAGVPLAIASTTHADTVAALLEQGGDVSAANFAVVLSADVVERPKPAPDVYQTCCERLGVQPQDLLVFEDSVPSTESALGAGVDCSFLPGEFHRDRTCQGVFSTYADFDAAAADLLG